LVTNVASDTLMKIKMKGENYGYKSN